MSTIEARSGTGDLEAFDSLADSIACEDQDELIVGNIYTSEQVIGRVGTWDPVSDGGWKYLGMLHDTDDDSSE